MPSGKNRDLTKGDAASQAAGHHSIKNILMAYDYLDIEKVTKDLQFEYGSGYFDLTREARNAELLHRLKDMQTKRSKKAKKEAEEAERAKDERAEKEWIKKEKELEMKRKRSGGKKSKYDSESDAASNCSGESSYEKYHKKSKRHY